MPNKIVNNLPVTWPQSCGREACRQGSCRSAGAARQRRVHHPPRRNHRQRSPNQPGVSAVSQPPSRSCCRPGPSAVIICPASAAGASPGAAAHDRGQKPAEFRGFLSTILAAARHAGPGRERRRRFLRPGAARPRSCLNSCKGLTVHRGLRAVGAIGRPSRLARCRWRSCASGSARARGSPAGPGPGWRPDRAWCAPARSMSGR
jgi:hypothetical protein